MKTTVLWVALLVTASVSAQEQKRPIPIYVDQVTVVPSVHGRNNIQTVAATMALPLPQKVKLWLVCTDANPHCYPLRAGQTYQTWAVNEGELGYEECPDLGDNFCVSIPGTFNGKKMSTIYIMGIVKEKK
jgi:hypothetical protein